MNNDIMKEYRHKFHALLLHLVENPILTDKEKTTMIGNMGDTFLKAVAVKDCDINTDDYISILIPESKLEIVTRILSDQGVSSLHEHEKRSS